MKLRQIKKTAATEIELNDNLIVLFSYETPVACWQSGRGMSKTSKFHSKTTSKHVSQFIKRYDGKNVREIDQSVFDELAEEIE